ncbi:MAG TPA: cupredoxin domain-containing protein [Candidatus Saccharimonadales bacterium]|nr:cupredoxin domain-containing protein [Candidatus Saccharimonadales bacterium]
MRTRVAAGAMLLLAVTACGGSGTSAGSASTAPASAGPAVTSSAATVSAAPGSEAPTAGTTAVIVKDFTLDPTDVTVAGQVALAVTNEGPTVHNVAIRDDAGTVLGTTRDLREGESETLTTDLPAGAYILYCSLPGHESLGITGTLTVSP